MDVVEFAPLTFHDDRQILPTSVAGQIITWPIGSKDAMVEGWFTPTELRQIADHIDRQRGNAPSH